MNEPSAGFPAYGALVSVFAVRQLKCNRKAVVAEPDQEILLVREEPPARGLVRMLLRALDLLEHLLRVAASWRTNPLELAVMRAGEESQGRDRADEGEKHIRLCIPWIALSAEEFVRTLAERQRHAPLDKLVGRA